MALGDLGPNFVCSGGGPGRDVGAGLTWNHRDLCTLPTNATCCARHDPQKTTQQVDQLIIGFYRPTVWSTLSLPPAPPKTRCERLLNGASVDTSKDMKVIESPIPKDALNRSKRKMYSEELHKMKIEKLLRLEEQIHYLPPVHALCPRCFIDVTVWKWNSYSLCDFKLQVCTLR